MNSIIYTVFSISFGGQWTVQKAFINKGDADIYVEDIQADNRNIAYAGVVEIELQGEAK